MSASDGARQAGSRRGGGGPWFVLLAVMALGLPGGVLLGLRTELAPRGVAWTEPLELTILHTNDLHGQVEPRDKHGRGGLLALGRRIRQERDEAQRDGRGVLLLDAGDMYQGTLEGDVTQGAVVLDWMNHLGYDAAVVGNHEFDRGVDAARQALGRARFPLLGANIRSKLTGSVPAWLGGRDQGSLAGRALIRELGPVKVAVIGLITRDTPEITAEGATAGLEFSDEAQTLREVLDLLPPGSVDLVVVLSHCGLETDERLAREFQGRIHVIVGGHSHVRLSEGRRVGDVWIAQTGSSADGLGRVDLELSPPGQPGQPARFTARARVLPAGDDLPEVLAPHLERVREEASRPVGRLVEPISREAPLGERSSNLGNLITDVMREASQADLAFTNRGGIRDSLRPGALLYRDVYDVLPFANSLVTVRLQGSQVLDALERSLGDGAGSALEVSGARVIYAPERPEGSRVLQVTVGGQVLDPARTYTVALNDFLADGKDGYAVFKAGKERRNSGRPLRSLLQEFLRDHSPYSPPPFEGRFRRLDVGD